MSGKPQAQPRVQSGLHGHERERAISSLALGAGEGLGDGGGNNNAEADVDMACGPVGDQRKRNKMEEERGVSRSFTASNAQKDVRVPTRERALIRRVSCDSQGRVWSRTGQS